MRPIDQLLPAKGLGFVTFNRGAGGAYQYGQAPTIEAITRVGEVWHKAYPSVPFAVGHISRKGGGKFPPHESHRTGRDIDVRPMRTDQQSLPVTFTDPAYSYDLTLELITVWRKLAHVELIFFNDPKIDKLGLARPWAGHHNHLHIRLFQM